MLNKKTVGIDKDNFNRAKEAHPTETNERTVLLNEEKLMFFQKVGRRQDSANT